MGCQPIANPKQHGGPVACCLSWLILSYLPVKEVLYSSHATATLYPQQGEQYKILKVRNEVIRDKVGIIEIIPDSLENILLNSYEHAVGVEGSR